MIVPLPLCNSFRMTLMSDVPVDESLIRSSCIIEAPEAGTLSSKAQDSADDDR